MEKKKNETFVCLDAINGKIPTYKYEKKHVSAYMLMLWFSHVEGCLPYIDRLNDRLFDMPDDLVFAALYKSIPKGKRFISWDKKTKDKMATKKKKDAIKDLMDEHGFSEFEAETLFNRYIDV